MSSSDYERTDMSAKLLLILAIAMVILAILMHLGLASGLFFFKHKLTQAQPQAIDPSLLSQRQSPPPPRLQKDPSRDYQRYLEAQNLTLNSYGWVDKKTGVARIPIVRAMEILAHEK